MEFGPDADFSPYYSPGVIALDACTAHSGKINVVVKEDEDLPNQDAEDERFREVTQRILEELLASGRNDHFGINRNRQSGISKNDHTAQIV